MIFPHWQIWGHASGHGDRVTAIVRAATPVGGYLPFSTLSCRSFHSPRNAGYGSFYPEIHRHHRAGPPSRDTFAKPGSFEVFKKKAFKKIAIAINFSGIDVQTLRCAIAMGTPETEYQLIYDVESGISHLLTPDLQNRPSSILPGPVWDHSFLKASFPFFRRSSCSGVASGIRIFILSMVCTMALLMTTLEYHFLSAGTTCQGA